MSRRRYEPQIPVENLDTAELDHLERQVHQFDMAIPLHTPLSEVAARLLFTRMWTRQYVYGDHNRCRWCGAQEGHDTDDQCIHSRVTNKLGLSLAKNLKAITTPEPMNTS